MDSPQLSFDTDLEDDRISVREAYTLMNLGRGAFYARLHRASDGERLADRLDARTDRGGARTFSRRRVMEYLREVAARPRGALDAPAGAWLARMRGCLLHAGACGDGAATPTAALRGPGPRPDRGAAHEDPGAARPAEPDAQRDLFAPG